MTPDTPGQPAVTDPVDSLAILSEDAADALRQAGYETVAHLRGANEADLAEVSGVSKALAARIKHEVGDASPATDPQEFAAYVSARFCIDAVAADHKPAVEMQATRPALLDVREELEAEGYDTSLETLEGEILGGSKPARLTIEAETEPKYLVVRESHRPFDTCAGPVEASCPAAAVVESGIRGRSQRCAVTEFQVYEVVDAGERSTRDGTHYTVTGEEANEHAPEDDEPLPFGSGTARATDSTGGSTESVVADLAPIETPAEFLEWSLEIRGDGALAVENDTEAPTEIVVWSEDEMDVPEGVEVMDRYEAHGEAPAVQNHDVEGWYKYVLELADVAEASNGGEAA